MFEFLKAHRREPQAIEAGNFRPIAELPPIKATGELPAMPPKRSDTEGLSERNVQSDPLGDWYLNLPDKLPPKQISSILRQALAGNLWTQCQLTRRMEDSWPMFKKCNYELRTAIASAKYIVHAYTRKGKKATDSALEKADLVTRALESFKPDRFADEDEMNGMIFDLTDAITNGVSVEELIWNENAVDPEGRPEKNIRAAAWVHPRNLAFTKEGRIGVAYAAESGNMSFSNQVRNDLMDNPSKFLVAKFKSKSGSPLGAGFMRCIAQMWVMVMYPRDYALMFSQKYGNPFMDIAYQAGITDPNEIAKFERLAKQAAAAGYFVHPDTAKLEIGPEHKMGNDNPQMALMRLADEACQLVMLGQTLTSSTPINGGTRAQGDVHENVRQERLEGHCKWIARILTTQFAESMLIENYAESTERPTVAADMTRPMSASEQAEYFSKVSQSQVPRIAKSVYERGGDVMPEPGDIVVVGGQLQVLEEAITPTEKKENDFDMQLEQQPAFAEAMPEQNPAAGDNKKVSAKLIQAALKKADAKDALELEKLVFTAERAVHLNGEHRAVANKVQEILIKTRA